ncbi:MAG: lysine biosynthesis protein LysW [Anaerolineaceae bacterium]|nr:lysine biosynthesis protein LysW [Anaerolineaceae bacterium]
MIYATCPNCHADVRLIKPTAGKRCICPGCSELLKVVRLNPIELDFEENCPELEFDQPEPNFEDDWNQ